MYLRISIVDDVQDLNIKNYIVLLIEVKDALTKCLWPIRLSMAKMLILSKLTYRFNTVPASIFMCVATGSKYKCLTLPS